MPRPPAKSGFFVIVEKNVEGATGGEEEAVEGVEGALTPVRIPVNESSPVLRLCVVVWRPLSVWRHPLRL